jgi:predicted FMN-binding regulatory protein PaiB
LSQNRPAQDQIQVIEQLKRSGSSELAEAMQRHENAL